MTQWFAVSVKPRHEKAVAAALRTKRLESFLPLYSMRRKWSDRYKTLELPLLAGYTFCRFEPRERVDVLRTPGVRKIVGFGAVPVPVEEAEIRALQQVVEAHLPASPCAYLRSGQEILIDEGPLRGLRGLLLETKGKSRLVVSITLLQRSVSVAVDPAWISPADWPRALRAKAG
jgi:transcription antitermination factor NusG